MTTTSTTARPGRVTRHSPENDTRWDAALAALTSWAAEHGTSAVPQDDPTDVGDGRRLGRWVSAQRAAHAQGWLRPDRADRLEQVTGWTWTVPQDDRWNTGYQALHDFARLHQHARVPLSYENAEGFRLGRWVANQRQRRMRGSLREDRIDRLEQVPGWAWTIRS